jgi:predicted DNA-binding protein (UPF0251 family)
MENKIDLKRLVRMRGKTQEEYASALNITKQTLKRRFDHPLQLTIEECIESDKCLELPDGTTEQVIKGKAIYVELIEYLNG